MAIHAVGFSGPWVVVSEISTHKDKETKEVEQLISIDNSNRVASQDNLRECSLGSGGFDMRG